MKISIIKYKDKLKLASFMRRANYNNLQLKEVFNLVNNLPVSLFCDKYEVESLSEELKDIAEFEIIKSQEDIDYELEQDFLNKKWDEAQAFYKSLSKEDKEKIDYLIRMSHPVAMA
jgi:hypothetical protein